MNNESVDPFAFILAIIMLIFNGLVIALPYISILWIAAIIYGSI